MAAEVRSRRRACVELASFAYGGSVARIGRSERRPGERAMACGRAAAERRCAALRWGRWASARCGGLHGRRKGPRAAVVREAARKYFERSPGGGDSDKEERLPLCDFGGAVVDLDVFRLLADDAATAAMKALLDSTPGTAVNDEPSQSSEVACDVGNAMMTFRGDFVGIEGPAAIQEYFDRRAAGWRKELPFVEMRVRQRGSNVQMLTDGSYAFDVDWRLQWVPLTLEWVMELALRLPWVRIERIDVLKLAERKVQYNPQAFFLFWWRFWFRGLLRMPMCAVEGASRFRVTRLERDEFGDAAVDSHQSGLNNLWSLVEVSESAHLVAQLVSGRVKNRRVAEAFALYADLCRPKSISLRSWNDRVLSRVPDLQKVPGGVMNVDGLDEEQQSQLVENAAAVLTFLTVCVLASGTAFWFWYWTRLQEQLTLMNSM